MDPKHVPYPEAVRQWGRGRPPLSPTSIDRYPAAKVWPSRRGRPAHLRISTPTATQNLRELTAQAKAPGAGASLATITRALYDAPLGRHGIRTIPAVAANVVAHREHFAVGPSEVAA